MDYVAKLVVAAALEAHRPVSSEADRTGINVFHLQQPARFSFSQLFQHLADCGYDVRQVPYLQWAELLRQRGQQGLSRDDALYPLLHFVLDDLPSATRSLAFDDANSRSLLQARGGVTLKACPLLDESRIDRSLSFLCDIGFLSQPLTQAEQQKRH